MGVERNRKYAGMIPIFLEKKKIVFLIAVLPEVS